MGDDNLGNFLLDVWRYASQLVALSLIALAAMFCRTLLEVIERGFRYSLSIWQSRVFIRKSAPLFEHQDWDGVQTLAGKLKMSHVAGVASSGLREFRSTHACVAAGRAVEVAERGSHVARNRIHEELRKGLSGLGSIATTAPLVGLFGTVIGIFDSFRGCGAERSACMAAVAGSLAAALATTALGMIVAVLAVWSFNWLHARLEVIEAEMRVAELELVKCLDRHAGSQKRQKCPESIA